VAPPLGIGLRQKLSRRWQKLRWYFRTGAGHWAYQEAQALPEDVVQAVADWVPNCAVEAAVAHKVTFPSRRTEYGPVLASVLDAGRAMSGLDYQEVLLRRMAFRGRMKALFDGIDLLLAPAQPFAPLSLKTLGTMGLQPKLIARLQPTPRPST
jgi:amidase